MVNSMPWSDVQWHGQPVVAAASDWAGAVRSGDHDAKGAGPPTTVVICGTPAVDNSCSLLCRVRPIAGQDNGDDSPIPLRSRPACERP